MSNFPEENRKEALLRYSPGLYRGNMLPIKQETRDMRTRMSMIEMETTGRIPTAGQFNSRLLITQEGDLFSRVVRGSLGKIVDLGIDPSKFSQTGEDEVSANISLKFQR